MSPNIVPTTRQTFRQAALVLGKAFVNEPVSIVVYRKFSPERRIKALANDFAAEMVCSLRRSYPVHVAEGEKVVAAAIIYPPGSYPLPQIYEWLILIKTVLSNGRYDIRSWMKWLDEADKLHPTKAHYYLPCIGVDPAYQGRGFGSAIMKHMVAKADQDGVGCYLENANPNNVPFYQRFGFEIVHEKEIFGFTNWFMWRETVGNK